jgi:hypothetical protein
MGENPYEESGDTMVLPVVRSNIQENQRGVGKEMSTTKINQEKYMVMDEQIGKKPKTKGFDKKKDADGYYMDLLDEGKNKTGIVTLYVRKSEGWVWLMQSRAASNSGRKVKK